MLLQAQLCTMLPNTALNCQEIYWRVNFLTHFDDFEHEILDVVMPICCNAGDMEYTVALQPGCNAWLGWEAAWRAVLVKSCVKSWLMHALLVSLTAACVEAVGICIGSLRMHAGVRPR